MFASLRHLIGLVINAFRSRQDLMLENLPLRQQLKGTARHTTTAAALHPVEVVLGDLPAALVGGRLPWFWSHRERWSSGIELVFASMGNGSPEPGRSVGENP